MTLHATRFVAALAVAGAVTLAAACGEAPAADGLPLWRITHPTGSSGSVSVLATVALPHDDRITPDAAVLEAFEASDRLVLPNSAVLSKQNALIGWKAHLAEGDVLSNWLAPEVFGDYVAAVGRAGFPATFADVTAPWFASRMVRLADRKHTGFAPEREFEVYFAQLARERGEPKDIHPLEESEASYDRHVALSRETQSEMMRRALYDSETADEALPAAAAAWRRGDTGALNTILRATDAAHPELGESLRLTTTAESARIADAVANLLSDAEPQRDFLLADARNVLGQKGVLARLAERGFSVERIAPKGSSPSPFDSPPLPDPSTASQPGGRALLVGIDGATLRIMRPLLEAGRLPNLAAIAAAGASGALRSHQPIYSPRIWNSIATGKTPAHHGVEGFTYKDADGAQHLYLSVHRTAHALWNIASDAGKRVAVVNWWNTYPPDVVNGVIVSDHAKPTRLEELRRLTGAEGFEEQATAYPAAWRDRATRVYSERLGIPGAVDPFLGNLGIADWMQKEELSKRFRDDAATARIALEVMTELQPELIMVFLPGIDRVSHRLWGAVEPPERYARPLDMTARQREAARDALHAYYAYSDELLGLLTKSFGEDDLVVVVSDHGFEAGQHLGDLTGVHDSEAALDGILFARGPGIPAGADTGTPSVNDVTPTILAWLGLPLGEDMDGEVASFVTPASPIAKIRTHDEGAIQRLGAAPSGNEDEILDQLRSLGYIE